MPSNDLPSLEQIQSLAAQGYNRIPLLRRMSADLDTPLSAYLKLAAGPHSFLLESVVGGERFGRYSIIGLPAVARFEVHGRETVRINHRDVPAGTSPRQVLDSQDPLACLEAVANSFRAPPLPGLPRFSGGLAGYFGYDTIRLIEPRLDRPELRERPDPVGIPDIQLLLTEEIAVFDNLSAALSLVVYINPGDGTEASCRAALERGTARLEALVQKLRSPLPATQPEPSALAPYPGVQGVTAQVVRDFSKEKFLRAVDNAKDLIAAGDLMQVVLAQQIRRPFISGALALYRALRALNPSPYLYFYDMGDFQIVGASPEILVRQERVEGERGSRAVLRPIAGTRPRGATREDDLRLEAELLADEKERAEHLMLIDLARNDVGRIAQTGSVQVTETMAVERYSHVMHIVSEVEGLLRPDLTAFDILRASFPAGTLSGAPKIRAMEVIDALEPVQRGLYGGACGYLSFSGEMDLAIAIRTGILKDGMLTVQAGAGVVADSVPEAEWQETENKARAVLRAAEIADEGLLP